MFYDNAERVELVGSHLIARIPDAEGRMKDTELDLNECIGNQNGMSRLPIYPLYFMPFTTPPPLLSASFLPQQT